MRRKFVLLCLLLVVSMLCCACSSSGIPREDYEAVVAERDEWKEKYEELNNESEALMHAKEAFSFDGNVTVSEASGKRGKTLVLIYWIEFGDEDAGYADKVGDTLIEIVDKSWFDYDYIFWDVWSDGVGRIASFSINPYDVSDYKFYQWY